jgi:hypothetical protein
MMHSYRKERGPTRHRRPMDVVRLVAFLGTPASELATIMGCDLEQLMDAERGAQALTPAESSRLSMWLSAAWWRHTWRAGERDARTAAAVREAASYAEHLDWVPVDWLRDLGVAIGELRNDNG